MRYRKSHSCRKSDSAATQSAKRDGDQERSCDGRVPCGDDALEPELQHAMPESIRLLVRGRSRSRFAGQLQSEKEFSVLAARQPDGRPPIGREHVEEA